MVILILRKTLFALSASLLTAMVAAIALQVVARELKWAVDWTEELGRFAFISMAFIAAAYGTLTRSHLRVAVVSDLLEKLLGARVIGLVHSVIILGFGGVMTMFSWLNFIDGLRYPNTSPALNFNQNNIFAVMCAGFAVITLLHLVDIVRLLRGGTLEQERPVE